jgi:hypothetical protein
LAFVTFVIFCSNSGQTGSLKKAFTEGVGGGVKVVEKRRFENPAGVSLERNSFGEV